MEKVKNVKASVNIKDQGTVKYPTPEKIANPSLATMGLMLDKNGKISRIPGSFLDLIDPFTGPTNIFKTLKGLWMGVDPYNDNKPFLPPCTGFSVSVAFRIIPCILQRLLKMHRDSCMIRQQN